MSINAINRGHGRTCENAFVDVSARDIPFVVDLFVRGKQGFAAGDSLGFLQPRRFANLALRRISASTYSEWRQSPPRIPLRCWATVSPSLSHNPSFFLNLLSKEDSNPSPAPAKKAEPAPEAPKPKPAARTPASRGGKYYARGGARPVVGEGNPNQDSIQEPAKRCEIVSIYLS